MSGNKYLLDTNIIIDLFIGNQETKQQIQQLEIPIVSAITIENYFMVLKNRNKNQNI
jgi:predicted nucleic acid-binding protein